MSGVHGSTCYSSYGFVRGRRMSGRVVVGSGATVKVAGPSVSPASALHSVSCRSVLVWSLWTLRVDRCRSSGLVVLGSATVSRSALTSSCAYVLGDLVSEVHVCNTSPL